MKVLDLQCPAGHRFEGWFASADDFESQRARKLVECPVCGATQVSRLPSAPRLNLLPSSAAAADAPPPQDAAVQRLASQIEALREVLARTENVGERFAEEARRIHYDEAPARNIRGTASAEDTRALLDEGIDVLPLPLPPALKGTLQ